MTRREAARKLSLFLAGSPLLRAQDASWIAARLPTIEALREIVDPVHDRIPVLMDGGIRTELAPAMGLSGCPNLASIDRSLIQYDKT